MATTCHITTAQQLLDSPDLGPCELVRGELLMMTPAGYEHARIVSRINSRLAVFVEEKGLGVVLTGEGGFHVARDPDTVRAPDVAFVRAGRVPPMGTRGFFEGPPDLGVEVVSPNDRPSQVLAKVRDWLEAGCLAVWVVDPDARTVSIHQRNREVVLLGTSDALGGGEIIPGFRIPVSAIFGA
jgi:Uma2 family endonuclease